MPRKPGAPKPGGKRGPRPAAQRPITRVGSSPFALRPFGAPGGVQNARLPRVQEAPPPPPGWQASLPEWLVFWHLTTRKHWTDGVQFSYQVKIAGGRQPGGQIADFIINQVPPLAWYVNGLHWHAGSSVRLMASQRAMADLGNRGYKVVALWEDDLTTRLTYTVEQALQGVTITQRPLPF